MAEQAALASVQQVKIGKWFSLEHPGRSRALKLPCWEELIGLEGVFCTFYHTCMFAGKS